MAKKATSLMESRMAMVGEASSSTVRSLPAIVVIVVFFASKVQTSTANIYAPVRVLMTVPRAPHDVQPHGISQMIENLYMNWKAIALTRAEMLMKTLHPATSLFAFPLHAFHDEALV